MENSKEQKQTSAVTILHDIRKVHERKKHFNGIVFLILLGILIIDTITIFAMRYNNLTSWGWIGLWSLIVAMGLIMKAYIEEQRWINTIDEFYLSKTLKYREKRYR